MGYVYLLLQTDTDGLEKHKIGITRRDPKLRVSELQTGNPNKVTLLKHYESTHYLKIERWMHRKHLMSKTEAANEWRTLLDVDVFSFVDDCKEAEETIKFLLENNSLYN